MNPAVMRTSSPKILYHVDIPFSLAHGGQQVLVEQSMKSLRKLGLIAEPLRWWDEEQKGDILHFSGLPSHTVADLAKQKNYHLVLSEFNDATIARNRVTILAQQLIVALSKRFLSSFARRMSWTSYAQMDAVVYMNSCGLDVGRRIHAIDRAKCHLIPLGIDPNLLSAERPSVDRGYLISMATIRPHKNTVLLAELAHMAGVPVMFLGKPYSESDPYYLRFRELIDGKHVIYQGHLVESEKIGLLQGARGFALLSTAESFCIAALEAAAMGCPLFLPDVPWARAVYGPHASFVDIRLRMDKMCDALRTFYANSRRSVQPIMPIRTWDNVAADFAGIYEKIRST